MRAFTAVAFLALSLGPSSKASTIPGGSHFCYTEYGCGPSVWPGICTSGHRQSPIRIPPLEIPTGSFPLDYRNYKGDSFRMQNNGHSVSIDFVGQNSPTNTISFAFPDPLARGNFQNMQGQRKYKLASIHFHWGTSDYSTGSEHCIGLICTAFEVHFVHYLANYPDMTSALASGDENALTVLGVLAEVSNPSMRNFQQTNYYDCFAPVVRNLDKVQGANASTYVTILEPIDFTTCAAPTLPVPPQIGPLPPPPPPPPLVYSYKGNYLR